MGCRSHDKMSDCVCDTLLSIVEAQDQVDNGCQFSCNTSIKELMGENVSPNNTIPVLLTCKGTCDLFVGTGVKRKNMGMGGMNAGLDVIQAVAFRVNDVDPETCCATLELLQEVNPNKKKSDCGKTDFLLGLIEDQGLEATNVCITVDLNCFCAVTCLPPVAL